MLVFLQTSRRRLQWAAFAAVAFTASLDEFTQLHERVFTRVSYLLGDTSIYKSLGFTWVLIGAPFAVLIAVMLLSLIYNLPLPSRRMIFWAGGLFLLGALGFETLGGLVKDVAPVWYAVLMNIEEWLEMLGVSLAIAGIIRLFEWTWQGSRLEVEFLGYQQARAHPKH